MHEHNHEPQVLTTRQLIRLWLEKKVGVVNKQPSQHSHNDAPPAPSHGNINTIAIVLDGEVQEVIRAENRMTALMLSGPEFILVNKTDKQPRIGWKYENGEFKHPDEKD